MPFDVGEGEELVETRDHRQFLGFDLLDPRPLQDCDRMLLDLSPVLLEPALRIELLGPEIGRNLDGVRREVRAECVGQTPPFPVNRTMRKRQPSTRFFRSWSAPLTICFWA
jgi:hypothetical protein